MSNENFHTFQIMRSVSAQASLRFKNERKKRIYIPYSLAASWQKKKITRNMSFGKLSPSVNR